MDIMKIGTQLFMQKLSGSAGNIDTDMVTGALKGLLPTSDDGGQFDLGAVVEKMQGGGLADMASS